MQFSIIASTIALAAGANALAVVTPTVIASGAITPAPIQKGAWSPVATRDAYSSVCPPEYPVYRGWFDQSSGTPPACLRQVSNAGPLSQPACPQGYDGYCQVNPGQFWPYDPTHPYCQNTGAGMTACYRQHATKPELQYAMAGSYCPDETAGQQLGQQCLTDPTTCDPNWTNFDLATTLEQLIDLIANAISEVVDAVADVVSGIASAATGIVGAIAAAATGLL